jgi:type I restriction enzyme S subunit
MQQEIAELADALEGQIALLRDTNATLEAIAQALFKSWFVDFDPVRAKAEGHDPEGVAPEVADLFPSKFEESELGAIPSEWQVVRVGELLNLLYGKAMKATDRQPGTVPVYGSGGVTGTHDHALVGGPTVIVGRKGTVGTLYWEERPCFPIDTVFYVKPGLASLEFCYRILQVQPLRDMNTDAAVPGLNRENVYRLKFCLPPKPIRNAFDDMASSLRNRMQKIRDESQLLSDLRDTLLPRLISGKLRIPEVTVW